MSNWYKDGEVLHHIPIDDRGFQYGDGLFETIAIRAGTARLWPLHMQRLARGCESLGFQVPEERRLIEGLKQAMRHSEASHNYGTVKIVLTAGSGQRGYGRVRCVTPSVYFGADSSSARPAAFYRDGIVVAMCKTRLAVNSPLAGLKTLNRLEQVLARSEFDGCEQFEGLTMDTDDNIICGTMSNVFFVTDSTISTPSLRRCGIEGVMRRHIIETLNKRGLATQLLSLRRDNLHRVDEVFVANSQFGVLPVRSCAEISWPVGPVTRSVMSALAANGVTEWPK